MQFKESYRQTEEVRQTKEAAMHSPTCCPLCALVWAFAGGGGIRIPLRMFCRLLGECEESLQNMEKR